ncbi:hypothetical protein ABEV00_15170 [Paenibacillus thiaminolyticus]|uniref:hypothetical protein n=1 Tax=Paenibacillus thiaminolyticus TaxID=49283 RepID=UPI003D26F0ED
MSEVLQKYIIFHQFLLESIRKPEIDAVLQELLYRSTRHHGKLHIRIFFGHFAERSRGGPSAAAKKLLIGQPLRCELTRRRQYPAYNSFQLTETSTYPLSSRDSLATIKLALALSSIIDKLVSVEELSRLSAYSILL